MSLSRRKWNTFSSASSEQRKFIWTCEVLHSAYILHFDWLDAHKNALEFQLVEIVNFEPVKLIHIAYCVRLISNVQNQVPGTVQFIEHCRCVVVHMNNAGPPPTFSSSCFPSWTQEWGWHCHSCCRWSWWLYCRRPTGYSVWYCSHRHPRRQEFKHTCTRPTTTTLNPLFLVVYRSIVCICTIKSSRFGLHLGGCGWKANTEFPFYDKGPYLGFDENVNENWFSFPFP